MQSEDITNDLPSVLCWVSQMASSSIRGQKTEDRIVVAAAPRHLYDRAVLRHTKPLSSVFRPLSSERGSTLITSLIILILLMLLGIASITTSDTQFKLAGNLQFEDAAMNNAEAAVSNAETWLATTTNFSNAEFKTRDAANWPAIYPINSLAAQPAPANDPLTMSWNNNDSIQVTGNANQRYIIEQMSVNQSLIGSNQVKDDGSSVGCTKVNTYRITARGVSARGAVKFVQSFFSVLIDNNDPAVIC